MNTPVHSIVSAVHCKSVSFATHPQAASRSAHYSTKKCAVEKEPTVEVPSVMWKLKGERVWFGTQPQCGTRQCSVLVLYRLGTKPALRPTNYSHSLLINIPVSF